MAVPSPEATAVSRLEYFKMCMYKLEMVAHVVMPALERWRQEDQKLKLFSATMQVQGQPVLHKRRFLRKGAGWVGHVHMGCIPQETEAGKSLELRSLRPAWVEQDSISGGKKSSISMQIHSSKKEQRQKEIDLSGSGFWLKCYLSRLWMFRHQSVI